MSGERFYVILNLFDYFFQNLRFCEKCPVFPQDLKKNPPTLTLPPSLRFGNRVAQLVPRWLPLFLKDGREELGNVGRHYYADRKTNSRVNPT